jgi:polyphosphate kinase 2
MDDMLTNLDRIKDEIADSFDEELEMEMDETRLDTILADLADHPDREAIDRRIYFRELFRLQHELVILQDWVQTQGLKVAVLFEGRDSAGKGGAIKRITQRLNPRVCRVVALPAPSERERTQWYFQRYVPHLPAAGEIVLFDRSWYNRAGVERVMGFCTEDECEEFFRSVPEFERMLVRSGIILVKYWFSITDEEQQFRFQMRIHDPLKQWKLSPMDVESRRRWEDYTRAKEDMLDRTHIAEAPWWLVEAVDKKKARLNCISHLLEQIPYREVEKPAVVLPDRVRHADYARHEIPLEDVRAGAVLIKVARRLSGGAATAGCPRRGDRESSRDQCPADRMRKGQPAGVHPEKARDQRRRQQQCAHYRQEIEILVGALRGLEVEFVAEHPELRLHPADIGIERVEPLDDMLRDGGEQRRQVGIHFEPVERGTHPADQPVQPRRAAADRDKVARRGRHALVEELVLGGLDIDREGADEMAEPVGHRADHQVQAPRRCRRRRGRAAIRCLATSAEWKRVEAAGEHQIWASRRCGARRSASSAPRRNRARNPVARARPRHPRRSLANAHRARA